MRRLIILVSQVLLAASRMNCANSPGDNVPLTPSAFVEDTTVSAMSGTGKGKKDSGDAQQGFWFLQNAIALGSNKVGGANGFASSNAPEFHRPVTC